jgi:nucleotide-binding universal stress UspA family protein
VQNPFRSEAEAFHLLVATIVAFGLTAIAAVVGGVWWGLGVFVVATGAAAWWYLRRPGVSRAPTTTPVPVEHAPGERRILVVANETVGGEALRDCIRQKTEGARGSVLVVSPALNSRLKHWVSDEDPARAEAQARLDASLARLRDAGLDARGEVGDSDPLQAIEDALRTFGADELIISTHPEGRSHWLERRVVETARERFAVPVTHVVVDLGSDREEVR